MNYIEIHILDAFIAGLTFSACLLCNFAPYASQGVTDFSLEICVHAFVTHRMFLYANICLSLCVFSGNRCGFASARRDLSNNRLVAIPPNLFVLLGDLLQLWVFMFTQTEPGCTAPCSRSPTPWMFRSFTCRCAHCWSLLQKTGLLFFLDAGIILHHAEMQGKKKTPALLILLELWLHLFADWARFQ